MRRRFRRLVTTTAATALVTLTFSSAHAGAAPNATPVMRAANSQSPNSAGYVADSAHGGAVSSASTAFTVPSVTCPTTGPDTIILAGVQITNQTSHPMTFAAGGVFVACSGGTLGLQTAISLDEASPSTLSFTPVAKDKITASVFQTSTSASVTVKDLTQHKSQTYKRSSFPGTDNESFIGEVTNGGNPPFGSITFSKDLTNHVAIGSLPNTALNEATSTTGGTLQILTSALNSAGNSFKTTFKHA